MTFPRTADHIREAARAEQYWVLTAEPGGAWALRQLDDTTGQFGPPLHHSGAVGVHPGAATAWAARLTGVDGWHPMQTRPGAYIEEAYSVVLELSRQPRPGRRLVLRVEADPANPGLAYAVVRERWDASGLYSEPLSAVARTEFTDDAHMLAETSEAFGVDEAGWTAVVPGAEWARGLTPAEG
ncbi:hypothetical protein [Hamadaea tsunoensis]|uniref:hypothetical protein n=1 Tax=Hamadaea tsunoensis TaxID=53368 RepID=UPI00041050A6|nr:hypothetical protein [Hamadaea tsunoensis]